MNKFLLISILQLLILSNSTVSKAQGSGNALTLDGNYGYVQSSTSNRGVTNQVTVEAWVKTTTNKYQWVAGKYDRYGAERGYHLIIKDGNAALAGRDGSGIYRNSGYSRVNVSDGKWHHLAGVCDGSTWAIYVDGILQSSITTNYSYTSLTNNAPFAIGKYFVYDDEFFEGQIDEVRVWKRALTEVEIRQRMCSKLTSFPSDLVAYYNFDAVGTTIVNDLSGQRLDGTLQNIGPSTAWVTSGAPIGDRSVYRYTNRWDSSLEMVTDYANFSVINVDPAINGFHLYSIQSPPASTNGIGSPQEIREYYGLFKVGDTSKKYKVYFKQYGMACGGNLYRRPDNTGSNWSLVADTTGSPIMLYNSSANYGEFAATSKAAPTVTINGPATICAGSSATLSTSYVGNGQIRWSTGETTKNIQIAQGGRYEVSITEGSCMFSNFINIQNSSPVTFSLGNDITLCPGMAETLSAPGGMAAYKWNTGEITQNIKITTNGKYWVEVTSTSGCITKDEIEVSFAKEPDFSFPSEVFACYGEPLILDATTAGASYLWSNGQTSQSINATASADYSVQITVDGCTYLKQFTINRNECPVIPNIITPNDDGKNDLFVVQGVEPNSLELKVLNRWGKPVYQHERYDNSWSAAAVPTGIYYYHFTSRRSQKVYKGWVEVLR